MKWLISYFIFSSSVFALSVSNNWEMDTHFEKYVTLSCSKEDNECRNFCRRDNDCRYAETPCRNCLGSNLKMSYIFGEIGRAYRNNGVEINWDHVYDLLRTGRFVTLNAKSIYNHVTRFNSISIRRKFLALCPDADGVVEPLAFFSTNEIGEINEPQFIACNDKVFELVHDPLVNLNLD